MLGHFGRVIRYHLRKLAHRARCWLQPGCVPEFTLPHFDVRIAYPLDSAIGRVLSCKSFEPAELAFVRRSLKPGDVFLDLGANGGIYTVVAGKLVGDAGRVYAFEPGRAEQALLRQNICRNDLRNVTVIGSAVSDRVGTARFAISLDGAMNSLRQTRHPMQRVVEWREVETTTLDDFLERARPRRVDIIKMDVEGAEKLVLAGARRFLAAATDLKILFEASDLHAASFGHTVKDFLAQLAGAEFRLHRLARDGGLIPLTNLDDPRYGGEIYNFVATR